MAGAPCPTAKPLSGPFELNLDELKALREHAMHVFNNVADGPGLAFAETSRDLWRRIHDVIVLRPPGTDELRSAGRAPWSGPALLQAAVAATDSTRLTPLAEAGWLTLIAISAIIAIAAGSAASASYFPKQTFGAGVDYLALFVSGFGSSTIAGILGTLLLWKRTTTA